jgi:hypothetical protein
MGLACNTNGERKYAYRLLVNNSKMNVAEIECSGLACHGMGNRGRLL